MPQLPCLLRLSALSKSGAPFCAALVGEGGGWAHTPPLLETGREQRQRNALTTKGEPLMPLFDMTLIWAHQRSSSLATPVTKSAIQTTRAPRRRKG